MKPVTTILRVSIGSLLLVIGFIGVLVPVMPQLPFLIPGALLLAPYVRIIRKLLVVLHRKYPQSRRIKRWFEHYMGRPARYRPGP